MTLSNVAGECCGPEYNFRLAHSITRAFEGTFSISGYMASHYKGLTDSTPPDLRDARQVLAL
jgi:hypothetical protein